MCLNAQQNHKRTVERKQARKTRVIRINYPAFFLQTPKHTFFSSHFGFFIFTDVRSVDLFTVWSSFNAMKQRFG